MRSTLLAVVILGAVGCGGRNAVQCEQDANCDLSGGGMCIASSTGGMWCAYPDPTCPDGYRYSDQSVGDGLAGECVPDDGIDVDAGVTADARPDADPSGPIVTTYQDAELVIGQPDFTSWADNAGAGTSSPTAKSIYYPNGACSDGSVLYIVDQGNDRVLRWNPAPTATYTDAQGILGKSSFTDGGDAIGNTATNLRGSRCAAAAGKLVVADHLSRRVLLWNSVSSAGQAADLALGTNSLTSYNGGATTQTEFKSPFAAWTDGTKIVVADAGNHRVMIWNSWPTVSGVGADLVLGQQNFTTGTALTPPTASSMKGPAGVWSDGTRLYVADGSNNRVLIWNAWPTVNGQPADVVIGQPDATSNGLGKSATAMSAPQGVLVVDDALFVADMANDRVLVFTPIPTTSGEAASYVLGQPDLNSGNNNPAATNVSLNDPTHMAAVGNRLYVVDQMHNRIMGFTLNRP